MVIVGGTGYFFGPFLGALVAVLLPEWLRFLQDYYLMLYARAGDGADGALPRPDCSDCADRLFRSAARRPQRRREPTP